MASEIRINTLKNRSGLSTVSLTDSGPIFTGIATFTGSIGVAGTLTYEDVTNIDSVGLITARAGVNVSGGQLDVGSNIKLGNAGVITATSFVGSGANLTGVGASFGNSSINTSGIITATAFVPTTGQLSHRNLIINGAMNVAQRGTSSTSSGYQTVDRFAVNFTGTDEAPTQAQVDVASGTTPYTSGFRKALKVTNGNQTSGAGADDYVYIAQKFESQDISNSGWNYLSSSSFITLSFWVKSSVAQNFYGYIRTHDGTKYNYPFETGSLTADTWTKITKTIAGNSNIQIDNDVNTGFEVVIAPFLGTNDTASVTLNQWVAWNSGVNRTPDNTSTWYTTNDATFEITGIQLEIGSVVTPFEHRSFGDELARCQRYYYMHHNTSKTGTEGNYRVSCLGFASTANEVTGHIFFPVTMRANPSIDANSGVVGGIGYWRIGGGVHGGDKYIDGAWALASPTTRSTRIYATPRVSLTNGATGYIDGRNDASYMAFSAEL